MLTDDVFFAQTSQVLGNFAVSGGSEALGLDSRDIALIGLGYDGLSGNAYNATFDAMGARSLTNGLSNTLRGHDFTGGAGANFLVDNLADLYTDRAGSELGNFIGEQGQLFWDDGGAEVLDVSEIPIQMPERLVFIQETIASQPRINGLSDERVSADMLDMMDPKRIQLAPDVMVAEVDPLAYWQNQQKQQEYVNNVFNIENVEDNLNDYIYTESRGYFNKHRSIRARCLAG